MMTKRSKVFGTLGVMLCAYTLTSCLLLFVYETYFRGLVVGTLVEHDNFDGDNGSIKRRKTSSVGRPRRRNRDDHDNDAITDRLHVCQLHNKMIQLPRAPDLILAGAMKSGTTYFWHLLREHPDFIPSSKFEAHFFDWQFAVPPRDIKRPSFWRRFDADTEEDYLCAARKKYIEDTFRVSSLMKRSETRLSYEKTPNYMFLPQIPELVHKICPWKPKIFLILRNPVDRAYSHFVMDSMKERTDQTFEEYIHLELKSLREQGLSNVPEIPTARWGSLNSTSDHLFDIPPNTMSEEQADQANWMVYRTRHMRNYLHRGMYSVQVERWMKYHPLGESLMVINNERLHREPRKVMREVLEFVGAPRKDYFDNEDVSVHFDVTKQTTRSLVRSMSDLLSVGGYDPMSNSTRHFLEKFYKPYNAQLQELLGDEWKDMWNYA